MKLPDIFKRKAAPKPNPPARKLKATARRAAVPVDESYDDYDDEPNVRLSKAFFVVMLLHLVAVAGIFAFSSFSKQNADSASVHAPDPASADPAPGASLPADGRVYVAGPGDTLGSVAAAFGLTLNDVQTANPWAVDGRIKEGDRVAVPAKSTAQPVPLDVQKLLKLSRKGGAAESAVPAVRQVVNQPPSQATPTAASAPVASGKFYTVQKGDNPVAIAKKLKVRYADLMSVNQITDPRKLQIGQKLIVPE